MQRIARDEPGPDFPPKTSFSPLAKQNPESHAGRDPCLPQWVKAGAAGQPGPCGPDFPMWPAATGRSRAGDTSRRLAACELERGANTGLEDIPGFRAIRSCTCELKRTHQEPQ